MAHSLSAKKRVRQNAKKRTTNRSRKSQIKTQTKDFDEAISSGNVDTAAEKLRLIGKKLDKAAASSTMHKGTAARKKSRLAKQLNSIKSKKV